MRKDIESLRYPIALPSRHPIVTKLILQKHIELLHAGVQTVMSALHNGKNLVGTSNELNNIDWKKVKDYGSLKKINWKLNPPSSPWWGDFENGLSPLTYFSEDQEDFVALTPAMFQQEIKENGVPDLDLIDSQRMNSRFAYQRRRFVEWAQNEIAVVLDFHKRILFSDEAHFWLNGYVNKQNCRFWSEANPQVYVETPLHPENLTVWCALWAGGILLQKR
ncbi:integrase catalytic domain-containing protein [Trichonephila clavipes]|nr:integrase catalytic domain-containing protein [Trichonephila clavipes]